LGQHRFLEGLGLTNVKELTHFLSRLYCGPLAPRCQRCARRRPAPVALRPPGCARARWRAGPGRACCRPAWLAAAEQWEHYLQQDYPQAKRFSLEGCEARCWCSWMHWSSAAVSTSWSSCSWPCRIVVA
jgi:2-oxoglutarate dehydrogenase E1 component